MLVSAVPPGDGVAPRKRQTVAGAGGKVQDDGPRPPEIWFARVEREEADSTLAVTFWGPATARAGWRSRLARPAWQHEGDVGAPIKYASRRPDGHKPYTGDRIPAAWVASRAFPALQKAIPDDVVAALDAAYSPSLEA